MREIHCEKIIEVVSKLFQEANFSLPEDVKKAFISAADSEVSPVGRQTLLDLLENAKIAEVEKIPICQDCGFAVVYVDIGQDVHIVGGNLHEAIQEGVRRGYIEGYLRKSIVKDPVFERKNTKDNTPAVIYTETVSGDEFKIKVMPKGGGSENVSALGMLIPGEGVEGVKDFVMKVVEKGAPNACPPIIVGVGIGGTSDMVMKLAKKALFRPLGSVNPNPKMADLEKELLEKINNTGIGPGGFGGRTTALAVHIEDFPCHIASMPVGVTVQCCAARFKEAIL